MIPIFSAITFKAVDFPEPFPPYKIVTGSKSILSKPCLDRLQFNPCIIQRLFIIMNDAYFFDPLEFQHNE